MGEPHTPPSGTKRGRQIVVVENSVECSPLPVPSSAHHGSRSVRRRRDGDSPSADAYEFRVYLPNKTSVEMKLDFATCKNLTVQEFVERIEQSLNRGDNTKQKQRDIVWKNKGNFYITDFQGKRVPDEKGIFTSLADEFKRGRGLLLHDDHPDTVHFHPDFWNVTPETHLLQILPQDYSVFSALADELDNSLQAVYQLESGKRLICVDLDHMNGKITIYDTGKGMDSTSQNSISKWGTMGSSMYRRLVNEAIGIPPPYLKPNFGMFGLGGIGAGLHLGGCIVVSSKTKTSKRVAVLHLSKGTLETNVKTGSVWKTGGEFRPPTEQELRWSPHGSFTKVEISNLNREITTWRVEEVQRKLKDFYFPYIQNDDGAGGMTSTPVEIRVNGDNLAGVLGGEVAHTNYFSGVGEPFVLYLQFAKSTSGGGSDKANARITCRYFPINKGREAIDDILEKLKDEDPKFMEPGVIGDVNFDNYSRRSIRRLGRLLPRARGGRLPFMEPKKFHRENEVNRHCYKRAKAFIDVDAGFVPTHSKTNLDPNHAFTEALLKLGSGLQIVDSARGVVTVTITHNGAVIKPEQLYSDYKIWITKNHKLDVDAIVDKSSAVIVSQPHHKQELNIKDDVFRVVYDITVGDYNWKVGKEEAPIRLKLLKGLPGLNNNDMVLYVTVECFISEGLADEPGETRIICRSMGVPEERGSKELVVDQNQEHSFILGESRAFPIEILFSGKCERVDEVVWRKQEEKTQSKSPAFVELLTAFVESPAFVERESLPMWSLIAGAVLAPEIIAVVRPKIWKDHMTDSKRLQQKYITAESMEMTLVVWKVKYLPPGVQYTKIEVLKKLSGNSTENVAKTYARKVTATTQGNLKGLYCFSTTANELEHITRTTGTYFLVFSLVSAKYQDVDNLIVRINVAPSSNIRNWNLCSHPGHCNEHHQNGSPEVMKVRLGGVLPGKLYLSRVDEFGNPKEFEEIPHDIECGIYSKEGRQVKLSTTISKDLRLIPDDECLNLEIPEIRLGQGLLEPLKPSMQAALRMSIAGNPVASFTISVLPGGIASARMKECDAPDNGLHPGQIIEKIIFEVLDSQQNPVLSGEQVKVVLEGFDFQDKVGSTRPVDGSGCLDLGLRLRVTAGYGGEARLELRSIENLTLLKKTFKVIYRSLRAQNVPDRVALGSHLTGIEIEAVDENRQVDHTMDGVAHNLTLDWSPNISVPFHRGVCSLPHIQMHNPGMWEGCVTHCQHQKLKTSIVVFVEKSVGKSERDCDDSMALENLHNMSQALPNHFESKALVLRDVQAPQQALDNDHSQALKVAIQKTMDESQKLKGKLLRLGRKLKKHEDERDRLQKEKSDHDQNMRTFQSQADSLKVLCPETSKSSENEKFKSSESVKLKPCEAKKVDLNAPTTADGQLELYNTSMEDNPGNSLGYYTPVQVKMQIANFGHPPGTSAAAILLQAQGTQDYGIMSDVIGIVALLGAVENEAINRVLVEFLGLENMLAIICGSTRAAECFGILNNDGTVDPNQGLFGLAQNRNLQISGRFRVITLADESRFYRRSDNRPSVNTSDPQKLLNLGHGIMSGSERPAGSLGYAVNFIHLNEDQLRIRILGRYGLRESLFFVLFGFLEIFDTTVNMLKAQKEKEIRSSAISLDGGIIRTSNQFEWGQREDPVVWFPTWVPPAGELNYGMRNLEVRSSPPPRRSIPFKEARPLQHRQLKEVMKQMEAARQRYIDRGIEENLQNITKKIKKTAFKIDVVTKKMEDISEKGHTISKMAFRHASKKEDS